MMQMLLRGTMLKRPRNQKRNERKQKKKCFFPNDGYFDVFVFCDFAMCCVLFQITEVVYCLRVGSLALRDVRKECTQ